MIVKADTERADVWSPPLLCQMQHHGDASGWDRA